MLLIRPLRLVNLQTKQVKLVITHRAQQVPGSFPGIKRPGCGVDYPVPSGTEVKEVQSQTFVAPTLCFVYGSALDDQVWIRDRDISHVLKLGRQRVRVRGPGGIPYVKRQGQSSRSKEFSTCPVLLLSVIVATPASAVYSLIMNLLPLLLLTITADGLASPINYIGSALACKNTFNNNFYT